MGKAVVATPAANEGIGAVPERDLLLAETAEGMAAAVLGLLADPARAEALGAAGRAFIVASWTWEAHFYHLEAAFMAAVDELGRDRRPARPAAEALAAGSA